MARSRCPAPITREDKKAWAALVETHGEHGAHLAWFRGDGSFNVKMMEPVRPGSSDSLSSIKLSVTPTERTNAVFEAESKGKGWLDALEAKIPRLKGIKSFFDEVKTSINRMEKYTEATETIAKHSAAMQDASLAADKVMTYGMRFMPDKAERTAVYVMLDVGAGNKPRMQTILDQLNASKSADPKMIKAYEMALNPTEKMKQAHAELKGMYDNLWSAAYEAGLITEKRAVYAPHMIDPEASLSKMQEMGLSGPKISLNFKHAKARNFKDIGEGMENGMVYKTTDAYEAGATYTFNMKKSMAGRELADNMKVKTIKGDFIGAKGSEITSDGRAYVSIKNQPALENYKWGTFEIDGKPMNDIAEMVIHPDFAPTLENLFSRSKIKTWYESVDTSGMQIHKKIVKGLDEWQQVVKATMLSGSPFHQVQEMTHGIAHRVNPLERIEKVEIDGKKYSVAPDLTSKIVDGVETNKVRDYADHGVMVGHDSNSANMFMEGLAGGDKSLLNRAPGVGAHFKAYQDYLFKVKIPWLKINTMEKILERNLKLFDKEIKAGEVTISDVKYLSATQTNAAYGNLNYALLGRNPTTQHVLQMLLLAPDFLEARARFAGQAIKGLLGGKVGREQTIAIATLAGVMSTTAAITAQLTGGDWDWKEPFSVRYGNRKYSMRTVPGDLLELYNDPGKFFRNRLNPTIGKPAYELLTRQDWRGQKIGPFEIVKEAGVSIIPLPARAILSSTFVPEWARHQLDLDRSMLSPLEQLASATGLRVVQYSPATEMHKVVNEYKNQSKSPKLIAEVEREEKTSGVPSDYGNLRSALRRDDYELAQREYEKLLKTKTDKTIRATMSGNRPLISKVEDRKMLKWMDEKQRRVYDETMVERKLLRSKFDRLISKGGSHARQSSEPETDADVTVHEET